MTKLDCQSQSNPPNWIAIQIEQSSNPIQQYPAHVRILGGARNFTFSCLGPMLLFPLVATFLALELVDDSTLHP